MQQALNFEKSEKFIPYDTVYIFNESPYIEQAQQRMAYSKQLFTQEKMNYFFTTADPEIFHDLLSSTIEYFSGTCELSCNPNKDSEKSLLSYIKTSNFDSCNNVNNLRYISTALKNVANLQSVNNDCFKELKMQCEDRLKTIADTRIFSMTDALNKCIEELNTTQSFTPKDIMLDFITNEINHSKEKGIFSTGKGVKHLITNQDIEKQLQRNENSQKLVTHANKILHKQNWLNVIYEKLNLENNQENMSDIAYKILEISKIVANDDNTSFDESNKITEMILRNPDYRESIESCLKEQNERYLGALKNRIQYLIYNDKIRRIDEKLDSISQEKVGFIQKILGKRKYLDAIRNNLLAQKEKTFIDNHPPSSIISHLIGYIKENGISQEIQDFIKTYLMYNLGIDEKETSILEELCNFTINEKSKYPLVNKSRTEYKTETRAINKSTEEILSMDTDNLDKRYYLYQTPSYSNATKVRNYINRIYVPFEKAMQKEINEVPTISH